MTSIDMGREKLVYVIDDDDAVRDATCLLLNSAGIATSDFASADAFLEVFEPGMAGCILLDLHMPGMSGLDLLELMQSRGAKTPVIVISGRMDAALHDLVRDAGAMAILSKPASDEQLLALIGKALSLRDG